MYDAQALQLWLLVACQEPRGLRDKPGKRVDFYHTCYGLSGLALCQHHAGQALGTAEQNMLCRTDALLNVQPFLLEQALAFYARVDASGGHL